MDRSLVRRAYWGAKSLLAMVGLAVLAGLVLVPFQGEVAKALPLGHDRFFEPGKALPVAITAPVETVLEREQRNLTEFIAKRYRVSETAVAAYVASAYRAGEQHSVDPILILAIVAVESRYNPVAESTVGAKGLMQVLPSTASRRLINRNDNRSCPSGVRLIDRSGTGGCALFGKNAFESV